MAILPTMKLRNKYTGKTRIVNQTFYADHLGSWGDWDVVSMRGGDASDAVVIMEREQARIEEARIARPASPAYGDAERAYKARSFEVTTAVDVSPPEPTEAETTTVTDAPVMEETIIEKEVPTIGGSQLVKLRGRPRRVKPEGDDIL